MVKLPPLSKMMILKIDQMFWILLALIFLVDMSYSVIDDHTSLYYCLLSLGPLCLLHFCGIHSSVTIFWLYTSSRTYRTFGSNLPPPYISRSRPRNFSFHVCVCSPPVSEGLHVIIGFVCSTSDGWDKRSTNITNSWTCCISDFCPPLDTKAKAWTSNHRTDSFDESM